MTRGIVVVVTSNSNQIISDITDENLLQGTATGKRRAIQVQPSESVHVRTLLQSIISALAHPSDRHGIPCKPAEHPAAKVPGFVENFPKHMKKKNPTLWL